MFEKLKKWWSLDRSNEADTADAVLDPLKWKQRRGWIGLMFVSFGWGFTITGMFIGSQVAQAPTSSDMIKAIVGGNLLLFLIAILVCIPAYRTGCNNSLMYRMVFGNKGWLIPSIIVIITGLGWQASLVGMFPDVIIGAGNTGYALVGLAGGLIVIISCYIGIKGLEAIGNCAAVFLLIAAFICIAFNINKVGGLDAMVAACDSVKGSPMAVSVIIDAIVGSWAVGAMFAGDFTRFCKKGWVVFVFVGINFLFAQPLLHILGITGSIANGTHVFTDYASKISIFFYVFCMIAMIFAIWTTCNSNLYFTQVQFSNVTNKSMRVSAVILGMIGAVAAAWGFFNYFGGFINVIVSLVPPMMGPWVIDYYVVNKMKYDPKIIKKCPDFNWVAFISYAAGVVVPMIYTPAGLSVAIWNIMTASIVYLVLYYVLAAMGHKVGYSSVASLGKGPYVPYERAIAEGEIEANA